MLIQYAIHDINDLYDETDRYEFNINNFNNEYLDIAAQECAENFYDNHDGWESNWPLVIRIFVDNKIIGDFKVEMEFWPSFSTQKIKIYSP
ncbi:MAG TPA: hypothetical protein ACHBX6_02050 [Arsenophonus nasoniae]|uniref:hypothetical protein n=1 Tax=Arsenophonus nasoniae TaxID=638 RepID=UPI0038799446